MVLDPSYLIDGNPNKKDKYFCGIDKQIGYAPDVVSQLVNNNEDIDSVMIISSSFYKEIEIALVQQGWRGEIFAPYKTQ